MLYVKPSDSTKFVTIRIGLRCRLSNKSLNTGRRLFFFFSLSFYLSWYKLIWWWCYRWLLGKSTYFTNLYYWVETMRTDHFEFFFQLSQGCEWLTIKKRQSCFSQKKDENWIFMYKMAHPNVLNRSHLDKIYTMR